jgi:hypothetical protein
MGRWGVMRSGRFWLACLVLGVVSAPAGCGTTSAPTASPAPAASAAPVSRSPAAAAAGPSAAARMICAAEARGEIADALGVTLRSPASAVWAAPVYRCTYPLTAGPLVLSVRELDDAGDTTAYFTAERAATRGPTDLPGLGDAAFATADGAVYVRKDFKVLKVDVSQLPSSVGAPPISRADAGEVLAQLIMGCWTGS